MLKNFSCFKAGEKKSEKSPDYRLSARVGEDFVEIGVGWIKQGPKGAYISFKLNEVYNDKSGFTLVEEKGEITEKAVNEVFEAMTEKTIEYPTEEIKPIF